MSLRGPMPGNLRLRSRKVDLKKDAKSQQPGVEQPLRTMASATHPMFNITASSLSTRSSTPPLPGLKTENFAVARSSCSERLVLSSCREPAQLRRFS